MKNVSLRNQSNYLISYAVPAATAALILVIPVAVGIDEFEISPKLIEKTGTVQGALDY